MFLQKTHLLFYTALLLIPSIVLGQKNNANWYFGKNAAIEFIGTPPTATLGYDNAMDTRAAASVSDSTTGELLFYTDGVSVWNKKHQKMPSGNTLINDVAAKGTLIVPYPEHKNEYFIFSVNQQGFLSYSVVDMVLDNGLGNVTTKNTVLYTNIAQGITAVKHLFDNSFWLITHSSNIVPNNSFFVFKIDASGVKASPTISNIGEEGSTYADLVSNHKGDKIAITHYANLRIAYAQVFDFDKQCGTISNDKKLYKDATWDYTYGAAFSADDSKLYIAYGYTESQLVQYTVNDLNNWNVVATSNQNFNDILLGPDGILYISTHDNNIPSPIIDALLFPDATASAVGYTQEVLHFGAWRTTNFEFPNLLTDTTNPKKSSSTHGLGIGYTGACIGDTTHFFITGNSQTPDSVLWQFVDPNSTNNSSTLLKPSHNYSQTGKYWVTLSWYRCGLEIFLGSQISIIKAGDVNILGDSSLCFGDSITLKTDGTGLNHTWSTGETKDSIKVKKGGLYWVKVSSTNCKATDSIAITEHPPILIELGNGFTVCEHDTANFIQLDAGKGYHHYKWTPTGDTSQWIIVKQAGDYYVVVEDYRGCKGDDGSTVARLCGFDFYLPNAFTPNGDGINDVFMPTASDILNFDFSIYNTWGERVFSSNNPQQGWDGTYKGKNCPQGIYLYKISFKGYNNKLLKVFNYKGNVSLVR